MGDTTGEHGAAADTTQLGRPARPSDSLPNTSGEQDWFPEKTTTDEIEAKIDELESAQRAIRFHLRLVEKKYQSKFAALSDKLDSVESQSKYDQNYELEATVEAGYKTLMLVGGLISLITAIIMGISGSIVLLAVLTSAAAFFAFAAYRGVP